jgi:lysophospholipid acyltransferase (LPLAT)-like uncharacterized protein
MEQSRNDAVVADHIDNQAPASRRDVGIARLAKSDRLIGATTTLLAAYVRLVGATSAIVYEPRSVEEAFAEFAPFIVTAWHGPAFLLPLVRPPSRPVDVLVSRHSDGELIARTLNKLGCGTIRGSRAAHPTRAPEKGGVSGFMKMKAALARGRTVAIPADSLPSTRGTVSPGQIALARVSGRPIIPVGIAARWRVAVGSWDRAAVSLPFNRIACVSGEPIRVPASADDDLLEEKRRKLETALKAATARAFEIVDRRLG